MRKLQQRLTPPVWARWLLSAAFCALSGVLFTALVWLVSTQSLSQTAAAFFQTPFLLTILFLTLLVLVVFFLSHSLFLGALIPGAAALLFAFVNYFKMLITSVPLSIGDFTLIGQVGEIARLNLESITLSGAGALALGVFVLWLLLALFFSRPFRLKWSACLLCAAASLFLFTGCFWVDAEQRVYAPLEASVSRRLSQTAANRSCGPVLGLWRSLYQQVNRAAMDDYSLQQMEDAVERAEEYCAGLDRDEPVDREQPTIIFILSESFFDPTTLPGVSYETDPVSEFHALQKEGVSGSFYTRTLGYGTCNIELEIFTGINTALLSGEDLYSWDPERFSRLPSVISLLRDAGYSTVSLHTYNDEIYHRSSFFRELGFDELYFSGDFDLFYPPAMAAENYWQYMETRIQGRYYSDDLLTDGLIALYEQKSAGDAPLFLYGISMENHSAYTGDKYPAEQVTVSPVSALTGEAADSLLALSQGVSNASRALGKLTDYFRGVDEPVVIVFYGDHRAGLGLTEGGTVYSQLGMVPEERLTWSVEEVASLYYTDYLIWSNDPAYLPGEPGSTRSVSSNYFGVSLLELAQAERPLYWRLLEQLSEERLCDTAFYHLGRDGTLSEELPEDSEGLDLLTDFLSDTFYGQGFVTDKIS